MRLLTSVSGGFSASPDVLLGDSLFCYISFAIFWRISLDFPKVMLPISSFCFYDSFLLFIWLGFYYKLE